MSQELLEFLDWRWLYAIYPSQAWRRMGGNQPRKILEVLTLKLLNSALRKTDALSAQNSESSGESSEYLKWKTKISTFSEKMPRQPCLDC